jgi:septal ring factor EnvC (AmiA/AmiB activator)
MNPTKIAGEPKRPRSPRGMRVVRFAILGFVLYSMLLIFPLLGLMATREDGPAPAPSPAALPTQEPIPTTPDVGAEPAPDREKVEAEIAASEAKASALQEKATALQSEAEGLRKQLEEKDSALQAARTELSAVQAKDTEIEQLKEDLGRANKAKADEEQKYDQLLKLVRTGNRAQIDAYLKKAREPAKASGRP